MNDQTIEQEIQAKGLTAPRITPADIEANIASEHYFTALDGIVGNEDSSDVDVASAPESLRLLTFCVLVLCNGFTVTGESACASPENFDAEVGRKIARQNAINKVWPLMGYELRSKLAVKEAQEKCYSDQDDVVRRIAAINRGDESAKFSDDDLVYAATTRCACGAGMAYPKAMGPGGSWNCSDILTMRAAKSIDPDSVGHKSPMPFVFYEVKSENQPSAHGATTRPSVASE